MKTLVMLALAGLAAAAVPAVRLPYAWLKEYDSDQNIASRLPVPVGYDRTAEAAGTFGDWLRRLPLKKGNPPVHLYNGKEKANQTAHAAVLDLDVGDRDLQQCADSVIRLRAEYLYAAERLEEIHFNFTSGDRADFKKWTEGFTPVVKGNAVQWTRGKAREITYAAFREYLDTVFAYAGTASLSKELRPVSDLGDLRIGDVFIQGGSPGHVVIVVDRAAHKTTGKKVFLLAQGFMPAQEMHVLKNPRLNLPWYDVDFGETLVTPEWTFARGDLKRF